MGGEPVTALNIVCYPRKTIKPEILSDILKGGHDKAMEAGCVIVGGHSVEDDEMKYGLAVTGKINTTNILKNSNAQPGDALVLTKPLGTGIATTAFKLGSISDQLYESVAQSMLRLNANSSKLAVEFGAHACTDVTGFGLLGHAWGMANASEVGLVLYSHEIPTFDGIENLAAQGFLTRGDVDNREYLGGYIEIDKKISEDLVRVLYDPQTSGGLLISVSAEVADELVSNIEKQGTSDARIIGRVTKEHPGKIVVVNGSS